MDDPRHLCFRDVAWLGSVGGRLTADNVLDYLALSPFWDRASTNEQLRMQQRFTAAEAANRDSVDQQLAMMTGVEFVVAGVAINGRLIVVHKRRRHSPEHAELLEAIYVLDGNAYMAPSLADIVRFRLASCLRQVEAVIGYGGERVGWRLGRGEGDRVVMAGAGQAAELLHPSEAVAVAQITALNASFLGRIRE